MTSTPRAAIALVGLAGALLLTGCTDEGEDGEVLAVGKVVEGGSEAPGRHVFVQTPEGRIDFTVTAPLDEVSVGELPSGRAPDDGALIGVSWDWDFRTAFAGMSTPSDAEEVVPHIRLVADGREYSLDEAVLREDRRPDEPVLDFSGTAYVGVAGEPEELAIAVEFAGLDQVVEVGDTELVPEGPAADLYLQPDSLARYDVDCGRPTAGNRVLPDTNGQCRLTVARVPYEPSRGWVTASEDRWLVVDARVWPEHFPEVGDRSCGEAVLGPVRYRLAGSAPVSEVRADLDTVTEPDRLVFATGRSGPDELVMTAYQTFPDDPGCTPLRLDWRVPV